MSGSLSLSEMKNSLITRDDIESSHSFTCQCVVFLMSVGHMLDIGDYTDLVASLPACCAALTELALNDTNAHQVVQVRAS